MDLSVRTETVDGRTILDVDGDIDGTNADELTAALRDWVEADEPDLVIDLRDVGFVDSMGLGALDRARRIAQAHHGHVRVLPSPRVRRVMATTGLLRLFDGSSVETTDRR